MRKTVILAVAPVPSRIPAQEKALYHPLNLADLVVRCGRAGASMVHLHVRDEEGELTEDLAWYDATLREIRKHSDIVIQGSTGGQSSLTLAQRCVALTHPLTEVASLNIGSTNFGDSVYINTLPDIDYWAGEMKQAGVLPELEVFDLSMVATGRELVRQGKIAHAFYNVGLGFPGALACNGRNLSAMANEIASYPGAKWGLIHHQMTDLRMLAAAIGLGANMVRVGFEDSRMAAPDTTAAGNEELVSHAAAMIRALGCEVATPGLAREMLGLKKAERTDD